LTSINRPADILWNAPARMNENHCPIGKKRGWGEIVLLQALALAWGIGVALVVTALLGA
jgi:hypothetical protein